MNFWQKICCVFFGTSLFVSRGRFWGKTHLEMMIFLYFLCLEGTILDIWGEIFMAFNKQCFLGFSKRQFTCPRKQINSFFWEKLWFFHLLSTLTKIILVYGKKPSPRGVKTAFGESRWRLWGFFFWDQSKRPGIFFAKNF